MARITGAEKHEQKRTVFEMLQKVSKMDIPMPMPIEFGYCENKREIFHLANMVIGENGQLGVIDWDTADFDNIGDPWYEFNRIGARISAFATGQIDGYFGNDIPDMFWKLFTFYSACSAITSITWVKYFAPECMNEIMKLNQDIVYWHDKMKNPVPLWYDKSLKYCNGQKENRAWKKTEF